MDKTDYSSRLKRIRRHLEEKNIEALIVKNPSNIFYITGLIDIEGMLVIDGKELNLFVPELYYGECLDKRTHKELNVTVSVQGGLEKRFSGYKKVGFIPADFTFQLFDFFSKRLKAKLVRVEEDFIAAMRMIKNEKEIKLIKRSLKINRKVFKDVERQLSEGAKETEIAGEIHRLIRIYGGRKDAFEPIVASGINSSYPHHKSGTTLIKKGVPVVVDAGTDFEGYKSDLTRTFFCGDKGAFADIYKIVKDVMLSTVDFIEPGKKGKDVHFFAVEQLKKNNLEQYFTHGLGHGVGIDVHEKPFLNSRSEDVISKGCVLTVEPGVYIPGKGGVRMEEMVIIE